MITQARLKKLLRYNPKTGKFFWRVIASPDICIGDRAGWLDNNYWRIKLNGKNYRAHRLAWLYVYGQFPDGNLDHKNRNPSDNRISNLRSASRGQNRANALSSNGTGFKGVSKVKGMSHGNMWQADLQKDGKRTYLGVFSTPEAAHAAYCAAAKRLHGKFFHAGG
jgi:HNH endonuclease